MTWNSYFLSVCDAIAIKSPCLSRNIGAILVQDKCIVSTGFNGPPRGVPHCGPDRNEVDVVLTDHIYNTPHPPIPCVPRESAPTPICPRKLLGYPTSEGMYLCPATHAEANCIANASRTGVYIPGSTLYLNSVIPCHECLKLLINAGVSRVIPAEPVLYDKWSKFLIHTSDIEIVGYEGDV